MKMRMRQLYFDTFKHKNIKYKSPSTISKNYSDSVPTKRTSIPLLLNTPMRTIPQDVAAWNHCNYCGTSYDSQKWPRVCSCCKNTTFRNPIPVAVGLLPFTIKNETYGLLLVRRNIKPFIGELCLPGGFIDWGESWQQAISREVKEETGIETDPNEFNLENVHSTPDGTRVLIFGSTKKIRNYDMIKDFKPTNETSELLVGKGDTNLCFSLHQAVYNNWFVKTMIE